MTDENQYKESNNNINKNTINSHTNQNKSKYNNDLLSTKEDLSGIEATEESLQNYSLSKEFLKLDLDKIRELIEILEEYCQSCIQKEQMDLANTAKQRVILLKRIEKEKMMSEATIIYSNQRDLVQDKMKEDLDNYLSNSNQEYESLSQKLIPKNKKCLKIRKMKLTNIRKISKKIMKHRNRNHLKFV